MSGREQGDVRCARSEVMCSSASRYLSRYLLRCLIGVLVTVLIGSAPGDAHPGDAPQDQRPRTEVADASPKQAARPPLPIPVSPKWLRLAKDHEVWLDLTEKRVLVGGMVCLRSGQLEMFACPRLTKEHESVVSTFSPARFVHAGLLALGLQPGTPVKYTPEYKPATGAVVDVTVVWKDKQGKCREVAAQQWVKDNKRGKPLGYDWVFVGSGFWSDSKTGERYYSADAGEFICVSNFPTAMLDLPIESSQANDALLFSAYTEHIPPLKTRVLLILKPHLEKKPDIKQAPQQPAKPGKQVGPKDAKK